MNNLAHNHSRVVFSSRPSSTMELKTLLSSKRISLAVGGLIIVAALAIIYLAIRPTSAKASPATANKAGPIATAEPTKKQRVAAEFAYPTSTGRLPSTVKISTDAEKARTRMTLTLGNLGAAIPASYKTNAPTLKIVSEYHGAGRRPDMGELSVQCTMSIVSVPAGVLASSSPPAVFTADGQTINARPVSSTSPGYKSKPQPDGSHESLAFKLDTKHLIALANAKSVSAKIGDISLRLSPAELADLREFVARMDPNP